MVVGVNLVLVFRLLVWPELTLSLRGYCHMHITVGRSNATELPSWYVSWCHMTTDMTRSSIWTLTSFWQKIDDLYLFIYRHVSTGHMPVHAFLSFQEKDIDLVQLFRGQAKNRNNNLKFFDYSVKEPINSRRAKYIQQKILQKIRLCSIVICLIGSTTYTSSWVRWELNTAYNLDKCLIGVRLNRDRWDKVPTTLKIADADIVAWRIDDIMYAIDMCWGWDLGCTRLLPETVQRTGGVV